MMALLGFLFLVVVVGAAQNNACKDRGLPTGKPLMLSPFVQQGNILQGQSEAKIKIDDIDLGYSGFFSVPSASGKNTNNLFTWYQPCQSCANVSEAPLLLWLQGGPGAPSSYGSTDEIGQIFINGRCEIEKRIHTWCESASCLFVDNPVQTGFSFQLNSSGLYDEANIEYTKTSADAGLQLSQLMQQFVKLFPKQAPSDFWLVGESYAGNYVANTAIQLLETAPEINLVGVSVGDPILNSIVQYPTYPDTLYGMGLVNIPQRELLRQVLANATHLMLTESCRSGFDLWNSIWNDDGALPLPFYYKTFTGSSMTDEALLISPPASFAWSGNWIATSQVANAMHFSGTPISQFNEGGPVYSTMVDSGDYCQNASDIYGALLSKHGIHVQIYSSNNDPLLGPPCSEAGIVAAMQSVGLTEQFMQAPRIVWSDVEGVNGYSQCFETPQKTRFCYTTIRNAGHEAPVFQPRACADMTFRFINNISFSGLNPGMPSGPQCSGAPPFEGTANCQCHTA